MDYSTLIIIVSALGLVSALAAAALYHRGGSNEKLKYEFITIIAHKFRTPLAELRWLSEELIPKITDPFERESLESIQKVNQHLIDLTNTLIELTDSDNDSRSAYVFERTNLCELVRVQADERKDAFHEKNIFLSVACAEPEIWAELDRTRVAFAIQVLLENALAYTRPGKNVDVSVGRAGRKAVIIVADAGIGIDSADMPHIFSKFFRAENARSIDTEGFGVGLFLARAIVRRHRGSLIASSPGKDQGSTFTLTLPTLRR